MNARRGPIRLTTLILGGILLLGGIAGTGLASLTGLGQPDYSRMRTEIPSGVTAVVIETMATDVSVAALPAGTSGLAPYVSYRGSGSSLFGRMPEARIELRGTTATISIADEGGVAGIGSLEVTLAPWQPLDSLVVRSRTHLIVSEVPATRIEITDPGSAFLELAPATASVLLDGLAHVRVRTDSSAPWRILAPDWYEGSVERWRADICQPITAEHDVAPCTAVTPDSPAWCTLADDTPGVCVDTDAAAPREIDFRGVQRDAWVEIRPGI